ncbi:MAG TPA: hypothetical protein VJB12_01675 [Candidatus Nanoarchaeia archaeon]|nr:hypothetical protein [Candidatus Nanoarchaeia archaeon]
MSTKNGMIIGATIAFLFYAFLSFVTPLDGKSVFPTANAINDPSEMAQYVKNLPVSMLIFISLEVVGMLLGAIGYKIISDSSQKQL